MGFLELAHCYCCGVTLDKRISDHGPDGPYRRGETPGLDAWLISENEDVRKYLALKALEEAIRTADSGTEGD